MSILREKIVSRGIVWIFACLFFVSSSVLPLRGAVIETPLLPDSAVDSANEKEDRSLAESGVRWGLAFAATSAIKGLFGMAPGYLAAFLPSMGASMFVPALIGAGLLEGMISLSVFSAITGVKDRQWLTRSFLMASVVSVAATFFLAGMMSPLALTLVSNGLRLAVFAMLTRPPDKSITDHIVDEVKDVVGVAKTDEEQAAIGAKASKASLSLSEIETLRLEAYSGYVKASDSNERTKFYNDFKGYSELLTHFREEAYEVNE